MSDGKDSLSVGSGVSYARDSLAEIKKVTFPTRQETIQATLVVIVMMVLVSAYLGLLDLVFFRLMQALM
jgi:preprotein translocase subunit SecE